MATFTCYLPDDLLRELDAKIAEGPDFNRGRASRSGTIALALERYLGKPASMKGEATVTVKDVFAEAMRTPPPASRAESFRRATQR